MEKEFQKPVCTGLNPANDLWRLTDFKPDGYGNWLMLSTIACPVSSGVKGNLFLMKLDSSFNVIWHKQYGDNVLNDIAGKILVDGSSYILSGGRSNTNLTSKNFIYRAELIKTDTAGKVQWTYLSPASRLTNVIQDVIKTQDGGYVYCGQGDGMERVFPNGVNADVAWKGWVEKIDANRNIVWNKTINNESSNWNSTYQNVLKELQNGEIMVAGSVWEKINPSDTENHHFGCLTKLSGNGTTLWQRTYSYGNDTLVYLIYDMTQTSDEGFILCGEARDEYPPYNDPTQRAWLIKVDSNGCMSPTDPQCHPTGTDPELQQLTAISLYPNPVSGTLYINNTRKEPLSVTIYDLMGRAVQEQKLHAGINELPMHGIPAGVYLYKLTGGRSIVQQGKLVKE